MRKLAILIFLLVNPVVAIADEPSQRATEIESYLRDFYSKSGDKKDDQAVSRYCLLKSDCLQLSIEECKRRITNYENLCDTKFGSKCCVEKSDGNISLNSEVIENKDLQCLENVDNEFYSRLKLCL